jgi:hypothetical protein
LSQTSPYFCHRFVDESLVIVAMTRQKTVSRIDRQVETTGGGIHVDAQRTLHRGQPARPATVRGHGRRDLPATRWAGPAAPIDAEARWERARRLLHDDTLDTEVRIARLLVLLYAQQPATIGRLTVDHLQTDPDSTRLRLGREPVVLPEPLAGLVRDLASTGRGHAVIGAPGTNPWLFPGGQPGRPISAFQLTKRLRDLGLSPAQSRSTALFGLATELPAAVLARMLGIHISVAAAWQRASAGDWTTYAAVVSRRQPPDTA